MSKKHAFAAVFVCYLSACASTADEDSRVEPRFSGGSDCITEGTIRSYRVLDDRNLIVDGVGRRRYHVTLVRPAFGLRTAWSIGFSSPSSRICNGFSEVIVDDSFGPARVPIADIRQLTEEDYDALLYRFGKNNDGRAAPPEPAPVEGADVEELD